MKMYRMELEEATRRIASGGRDPDDFAFAMEPLPPEPDGGGMFTAYYKVEVVHRPSGRVLAALGGIGANWVEHFAEAVRDGYFDTP